MMLDRLSLQVPHTFRTAAVSCWSTIDIVVLYRLGLPRPNVESPILQLLYILEKVYRSLPMIECLSHWLRHPISQGRPNRPVVIVELFLKVVLAYVYNALKLRDLRVVRPLKVHPTRLSLDLSKPIFIVSSLDILITTTSANIGPSTLVFLLY